MDKRLQQIWEDLAKAGMETDKNTVHSYVPVYEVLLEPYRYKANLVLEVGLFNGHSLRMWEQYFENAKVYGIDCDKQPHGGMADLRPMIATNEHNIVIGDATSETEIEKHFGDLRWDVVVDDGNHQIESQLKTIEVFSKRMNAGGLIIVEDVQNIDEDRRKFDELPFMTNIIDLRHIKQRYDDVIVLIKF